MTNIFTPITIVVLFQDGTRQRHGRHRNQRLHQGIVRPGNSAVEMVNVLIDQGFVTVVMTVVMEVTKTGLSVVIQQIRF